MHSWRKSSNCFWCRLISPSISTSPSSASVFVQSTSQPPSGNIRILYSCDLTVWKIKQVSQPFIMTLLHIWAQTTVQCNNQSGFGKSFNTMCSNSVYTCLMHCSSEFNIKVWQYMCNIPFVYLWGSKFNTTDIYFILHYLLYLKTLLTPKNILQGTSEMCAKIHRKCTLFWSHFNWNEMDQQPSVNFSQYQM